MSDLEKSFEVLKKYMYLVDVKAIEFLVKLNTLVFVVAGIYFKSFAIGITGFSSMPLIICSVYGMKIWNAYQKDMRDEKTK